MSPFDGDGPSDGGDAGVQVQSVLSAVADPDCRAILGAADDRMTATELSNATTIPRSTVYRKLDRLEEAGLVDTTRRFETDGKHPTEYVRSFERIRVSVGANEDFDVFIGDDAALEPEMEGRPPATESATVTAPDHANRLGDLFVSMTGQTTLIDPQREAAVRPDDAGDDDAHVESRELEEYVAMSIADDGLQEAIEGADTELDTD